MTLRGVAVLGCGVLLLSGCQGGAPSDSAPGAETPASATMTLSPDTRAPTAPTITPQPTPQPTSLSTPPPTPPTSPRPTTTRPTPITTGRIVSRLSTGNNVIALTFDAGSGSQGAASIIATLSRDNVPATFFLTGAFATANPATSSALAKLGAIGNHTSSHPHLPQLTTDGVRQEVTSARTAILGATGRDPVPRFRFPFGEYDARTLNMVNEMGYAAVGWTVDTLGWKGASAGVSVATITARVAQNRAPGEIVLMHIGAAPDGSTLDADALPMIIAQARSAGYSFVSITRP